MESNNLMDIEFVKQARSLIYAYIKFKEERDEKPCDELYQLYVFCNNLLDNR
jgi:hypothetical protein